MKLAIESELTIDDLKKYGEYLIEPVMKTNLFTAINMPPYGQALILPLDLFNRILEDYEVDLLKYMMK